LSDEELLLLRVELLFDDLGEELLCGWLLCPMLQLFELGVVHQLVENQGVLELLDLVNAP
jgi:hypothetical protein